jgi:hypothetical protein
MERRKSKSEGEEGAEVVKNEISPKAYPEEMEVIRTTYANTSFGTLFPFFL